MKFLIHTNMLQDQINWQQWAWWESESTNPKSLPEEASIGRRTSSAFGEELLSVQCRMEILLFFITIHK